MAERRGRFRGLGDALRRRGLPEAEDAKSEDDAPDEEPHGEETKPPGGGKAGAGDAADAEQQPSVDETEKADDDSGTDSGGAGMPARPSLGDLREDSTSDDEPPKRSRRWLRRRRGKDPLAAEQSGGADAAESASGKSAASGDDALMPWAAGPGIEEPKPGSIFGSRAAKAGSEAGDGNSGTADQPEKAGDDKAPEPVSGAAVRGTGLGNAGVVIGGLAKGALSVGRELGTRAYDAWFTLSLLTRQRIAAAGVFVALVLIVVFVIAPIAPCWAPGGDRCAPDDDAVVLAPADADGYIHINLDPDTDQSDAGAAIANRLPGLTTQAGGLLAAATGRLIDYRRDIEPWSGGELAVVLDAGLTGLDSVVLVEVGDQAGADAFTEMFLGDGVEESDLDGITVQTDSKGTSAATAGGFLILGPEKAVSREVALARGSGGETLGSNPDYERAEAALPDDRLADAWLSPEFSKALFDDTGDAATFDTFVNSAATQGVAAALSVADEDTIQLTVHSLQDAEASKVSEDFFDALPAFEPTLADSISADALVYLGLGNPATSARTLVGRAADTAPDLFKGLKRFNRNLENKDDVDLEQDLLPILDGQAALTVEPQQAPGQSEQADTPGTLAPTGAPYLALLATGVDTENALSDLAELQGPIANNVDPSQGQAPVFSTAEIAGVEAHSLRLSPAVDLTYAGYDDDLIVGTSPLAVERARSDADRLGASRLYEQATTNLPESMSMLLYLNAKGLLSLGERLFLAEDPTYAQLAPDLRTLEALAMAVQSTDTDLGTTINITVGQPEQVETEPEPLAPTGG